MTYFTIDQIEQANAQHGHHWFEAGTMRFFKSRVSGPVINGRYFVSSERGPSGPRLYSIRVADADGAINTVPLVPGKGTSSGFQAYSSKRAALSEAHTLAGEGCMACGSAENLGNDYYGAEWCDDCISRCAPTT